MDLFYSCLRETVSNFSKTSFRNTIKVPNDLDPDQGKHYVGTDLGSKCLQRLRADAKSRHKQEKGLNKLFFVVFFTRYSFFFISLMVTWLCVQAAKWRMLICLSGLFY